MLTTGCCFGSQVLCRLLPPPLKCLTAPNLLKLLDELNLLENFIGQGGAHISRGGFLPDGTSAIAKASSVTMLPRLRPKPKNSLGQ